MKKFLAMMMMAGLVSVAGAADKLGVVDMEDLIRLHPNTAADKKLLETTVKEFEAERDKLRARIKELNESFEKAAKEFDNPALNEKAKAKAKEDAMRRRDVLVEADRDMQDTVRKRQRELNDQEMRMLKRTTDELRQIIGKYAKDKKYTLVVAANTVAYYDEDIEITNEILKQMGVDPALRKALPAAETK